MIEDMINIRYEIRPRNQSYNIPQMSQSHKPQSLRNSQHVSQVSFQNLIPNYNYRADMCEYGRVAYRLPPPLSPWPLKRKMLKQ